MCARIPDGTDRFSPPPGWRFLIPKTPHIPFTDIRDEEEFANYNVRQADDPYRATALEFDQLPMVSTCSNSSGLVSINDFGDHMCSESIQLCVIDKITSCKLAHSISKRLLMSDRIRYAGSYM